MGNWSNSRHMVEASKQEALEAVDHYNRPLAARGLEGFLVHMHIAWLYLMHAEFARDKIDYRYRLPNGRLDKIDGEPRRWDLAKCVRYRFSQENDPVRKNLEMSILLRNKVEHRHERNLGVVAAGKAHALLINYQEELISQFGEKHSLGDSLRFPVFLSSLIGDGNEFVKALNSLPTATRNALAKFEADLDPAVSSDPRYEFRVVLTQKVGPRGASDVAIEFVRDADLTDEQRELFKTLGKDGKVLVREQLRPVADLDGMRPKDAVAKIDARVPFEFGMHHFTEMWRHLKVRPPTGDQHPERTMEQYCIYDRVHRDYVYTPAFVEKVLAEIGTAAKFAKVFGKQPRMKISTLPSASATAS